MADRLYLLYRISPEDEKCFGSVQLFGIYATKDKASAAILRAQDEERSFRFQIACYELDKDHWNEGFIKGDEVRA